MTSLQPQSNNQITPAVAARELLRRRVARASVLSFVEYVNPVYDAKWYHRLVCQYLDKFVSREIENLMVFYPPQHGKSQLVSRSLPAFIFGKNPDAKVIAASYAAELIQGMNRDVQRILESNEYRKLFPETRLNESNVRTVAGSFLRNNDIFEIVGRRGQYRCAGVGGGLTGFPCDFGIIDDPYKDYKEASSETVRRGVWEWYTSVFLSRTHVNTGKLITLTRWHEDDLAGRLLDLEPNKWTVLKLPAICEFPKADYDLREIGDALWCERFPIETLRERQALNPHQFEALYQQNPTAREGAFFKVDRLEIIDTLPIGGRGGRGWDKAATAGGGDYTASVKVFAYPDGSYVIADVVRGQWDTAERDRSIRQVAELDGRSVRIKGEQEPGSAGKDSAEAFIKLLSGFSVRVKRSTANKQERADPFSSQVNAGNVRLLRGDWNQAFIEELRSFPQGKNDDQVDAASLIFNDLASAGIGIYI